MDYCLVCDWHSVFESASQKCFATHLAHDTLKCVADLCFNSNSSAGFRIQFMTNVICELAHQIDRQNQGPFERIDYHRLG